jgi:peptidoglycan/LPS O-acetylase OafA/YrhL
MDALDVVRLPLFTAMAGYIYGAMPVEGGGVWRFMRQKLQQLALPALLATLAFWMLRIVVYDDTERGLLPTLLKGYEHLWYIYALLVIFAVVATVDALWRPGKRVWLLLIPLCMVAYWTLTGWGLPHLRNAAMLLPFFILGVVIQRKSDWMMWPGVSVLAAACLALSVAFVPLGTTEAINFDRTGVLTWIGGTGALVLLLRHMPKLVWLEIVAAYSFTIYLWHPAAAAAMRNGAQALGLQNTPLLFALGLAAGVVAPVLLHLTAQRLPKFASLPLIGR